MPTVNVDTAMVNDIDGGYDGRLASLIGRNVGFDGTTICIVSTISIISARLVHYPIQFIPITTSAPLPKGGSK